MSSPLSSLTKQNKQMQNKQQQQQTTTTTKKKKKIHLSNCSSVLWQPKGAPDPSAMLFGHGISVLWRSSLKQGMWIQSAPLWSQESFPWEHAFRTVEIAYIFLLQLQREIIGTLNKKI